MVCSWENYLFYFFISFHSPNFQFESGIVVHVCYWNFIMVYFEMSDDQMYCELIYFLVL